MPWTSTVVGSEMPGTVASLQAFRSGRAAGAAGDGRLAGASHTAVGEEAAVAYLAMAAEPAGGADRARRFRELALPQLDAAYNLARHLARDADAAEASCRTPICAPCAASMATAAATRGPGSCRSYATGSTTGHGSGDWTARCRCQRGRAGRRIEMGPDIPDPDGTTPEEVLAGTDEAAAVRTVVSLLPAPFREALVLREMEDLSYREIATVMGVPIGTVMSRLARARQMFGEAWRRLTAADEGRDR